MHCVDFQHCDLENCPVITSEWASSSSPSSSSSSSSSASSLQRWKIPESFCASGKFLRVQKENLLNCPDFSGWLPIFRMISRLSGFSRWFPNFQVVSNCLEFSGWFWVFARGGLNDPQLPKTWEVFVSRHFWVHFWSSYGGSQWILMSRVFRICMAKGDRESKMPGYWRLLISPFPMAMDWLKVAHNQAFLTPYPPLRLCVVVVVVIITIVYIVITIMSDIIITIDM